MIQKQEQKLRLTNVVQDVRRGLSAIMERLLPAKIKGEKFDAQSLSGSISIDQQLEIIEGKLDAMRSAIQTGLELLANHELEGDELEHEVTIEQVKDTLLKLSMCRQ